MTNLTEALCQVTSRWVFALTLGCLLAGPALAAETEETDLFNMETMVCWDLTPLEDEDRGFALVLAYGYVIGVQDMPEQDSRNIEAAFEYMGRLCDANPDMYVVSVVERALDKYAR